MFSSSRQFMLEQMTTLYVSVRGLAFNNSTATVPRLACTIYGIPSLSTAWRLGSDRARTEGRNTLAMLKRRKGESLAQLLIHPGPGLPKKLYSTKKTTAAASAKANTA
jgi:hypothetical protein